MIQSAVDCLDGMIQNKLVSVVVAEKEATDLLMKIMRSQDWNQNEIIKCARVVANIATQK